jgi:ribosomal protein S21
MVKVERKSNESIEGLLRRFNKKVDQSGVLQELWYRRYYRKPSLKKKEKKIKVWS